MLLQSQHRWTGGKTIHSEDLPWLLADWLPGGCLGVPADAQSGSQDMFLRLSGDVAGFALKHVSATPGTQWDGLRDELKQAPALSAAGALDTLVLCSLHLSPALRLVVGDADAEVFEPGAWMLCGEKLMCKDANAAGAPSSDSVFTVVNPLARACGGLRELLCNFHFDALQAMGAQVGDLSIQHLTEWMARTPPPPSATIVAETRSESQKGGHLIHLQWFFVGRLADPRPPTHRPHRKESSEQQCN
jgi:hypothetical protein